MTLGLVVPVVVAVAAAVAVASAHVESLERVD